MIDSQLKLVAADRARWGTRRSLYMLLMRTLKRLLNLHVAHVHTRVLKLDSSQWPPPDEYDVRLLDADDLYPAAQNSALEMSTEFLDDALAAGHLCFGAFFRGDLVAYTWRSFSDAPCSDGFRIHLHKKLRYSYKSLTLPAHRGRHIQTYLSYLSDEYCLPRGYGRGVSYVETHNYPSLTGDWRRGNEIAGRIAWMDKGPLRWCWTSAAARRIGLELFDPRG